MTSTSLFVQLFMGFLLNVALADFNCSIRLDPPKVVAEYGSSVTLNCTVDGEIEGMGWEAPVNGTGRLKVNRLSWTVESVSDETTDVICFASAPSLENDCLQKAHIVLYTVPEVSITSNSGQYLTREGQELDLTCEVKARAPAQHLSVVWYKDDKPLTDFANQTNIHFTPGKEDNEAEFKCEARLDLRPEGPFINVSSEKTHITVFFGPEMICASEEIAEGETLDSKCPVLGEPTPYFTWDRNGLTIDSNRPLNREDAGIYSLHAEGIGVLQKTVTVRVLYGPELSCSDNYTALEHTAINLNCTSGGYPKPNVTLYKDDEEVDLGNVTRNDAGSYTLVASAGNRSVSQSFEVVVYYPPRRIEDELRDWSFTPGSAVDLKCSAKANPRPKYRWTYYRTANVSEENDDGVSILVIHQATTSNMGDYTCCAWNEHGTVCKTARLTVQGAKQECPLQIRPVERMVLEHRSEGRSVLCQTTSAPTNVKGMHWQDNTGSIFTPLEWVVDTEDWDAGPVSCEGDFHGIGKCSKRLDVILYKKPDSVSISTVSTKGGIVTLDDTYFTLVCEITSVAPANNVVVRWFQGNTSMTLNEEDVRCYGCDNTSRRDVNVSFSTNITINKALSGAEFSCEAAFNLPEIQNITLPRSRPLNITVNYQPLINATKLSSPVPVFSGYAEDLQCEADGNPRPEIRWSSNVTLPPQRSADVLSVTEKGIYRCTATNAYGSDYRDVEVIVKVDYLPLLAGFVAVTVVIISIIFVFIYSIYYKNTKMRRYNLKNPKLGALNNGNVAHNGWDLPLPMTKLP